MLASALLTFREDLEAALLVSIIPSYLAQIGHQHHRALVWTAVSVAAVLSLALALGILALVRASKAQLNISSKEARCCWQLVC